MKVNVCKILNLMYEKELTQRELAEKSGVSRNSIGKILKRKQEPLISTVGKIADCLGCSVSDLAAEV